MNAPLSPAEALSLAVHLRLHVDLFINSVDVYYRDTDGKMTAITEDFDGDALAATCRAIQRAGAIVEALGVVA